MFDRKIYAKMGEWKKSLSTTRSALIISGLRQVGKTFSALRFAEGNYENVVYLNFAEKPETMKIFRGNLDPDQIFINLTGTIPGIRIVPGKTVLIFDELQDCPPARTSLKFLAEDGRVDVICTGSLQGVKGYDRTTGGDIPAGFEYQVDMYPMDFEEYLWARGFSKEATQYVRTAYEDRKPLSQSVLDSFSGLYREYLCVGGLPSVVSVFLDSKDLNEVFEKRAFLINAYRSDFAKHLTDRGTRVDQTLLARINEVFESAPSQLAKENNKFTYSGLLANGGREYLPAIEWLCGYGLLCRCERLTRIERPLEGFKDRSSFKLYFSDPGILMSLIGRDAIPMILNGEPGTYKGAIYESAVACSFEKAGRPLYYFRKNSGLEIDFVTVKEGKTCIVEVKSKTGRSKSAMTVLNDPRYRTDLCIKFGDYNIGFDGKVLTLPSFMPDFLERPDEERIDYVPSQRKP